MRFELSVEGVGFHAGSLFGLWGKVLVLMLLFCSKPTISGGEDLTFVWLTYSLAGVNLGTV